MYRVSLYTSLKVYLFIFLAAFFLAVSYSNHSQASEKDPELLSFDKGYKKNKPKNIIPANICQVTPCIIGKYGTIYFSKKDRENYSVHLGLIHNDAYQPIALFQEASNLDEKFGERFLNKRQNRSIFDLASALETSEADILYIYGIMLHYTVAEGDLIVVRFIDKKNSRNRHTYFFRYHRSGAIWDADVALISPIKLFVPNPDKVIRGASISVALSISVGWYMNPEKKYTFGRKFLHAWRFNVFSGLLRRRELTFAGADRYVDTKMDGFVGAGFTFVDFFVGGIGVNLARTPHAAFPFVGLEVKHLYQFIRSLKKSTKKRWKRYLTEEEKIIAEMNQTK
jgi:hypothetical protein